MSAPTPLLDVQRVSKRYGDFHLADVSLTVHPDEIVGFVGANGAGKSTTIKAALALIHVDAGEARLFGEPLTPGSPTAVHRRLKERIGVVFDAIPFPQTLKVAQVGRIYADLFGERWNQQRFDDLTGEFNLPGDKPVKELSRGMGMGLQLATALAHDPDLLVLDEATAGLDPMARDHILDILLDHMKSGGRGVLISSHITTDLDKAADRVVGIDGGRILFDREKDSIRGGGIAHLRRADLERLEAAGELDGTHVRERAGSGSVDILVEDRGQFARRHPDILIDPASVEDFLEFQVKGALR